MPNFFFAIQMPRISPQLPQDHDAASTELLYCSPKASHKNVQHIRARDKRGEGLGRGERHGMNQKGYGAAVVGRKTRVENQQTQPPPNPNHPTMIIRPAKLHRQCQSRVADAQQQRGAWVAPSHPDAKARRQKTFTTKRKEPLRAHNRGYLE